MRKHFLNLSNGVEALAEVQRLREPYSFVRFRSTTIERRNWWHMFETELCEDLLMHLALGWKCVLHDRGTLRPNSKTCYFGVPLIRYTLHRFWFDEIPHIDWVGPKGGPSPSRGGQFDEIYQNTIGEKTGRGGRIRIRLNYYARFLTEREVRFTFRSASTTRDGDADFQVKLAQKGNNLYGSGVYTS